MATDGRTPDLPTGRPDGDGRRRSRLGGGLGQRRGPLRDSTTISSASSTVRSRCPTWWSAGTPCPELDPLHPAPGGPPFEELLRRAGLGARPHEPGAARRRAPPAPAAAESGRRARGLAAQEHRASSSHARGSTCPARRAYLDPRGARRRRAVPLGAPASSSGRRRPCRSALTPWAPTQSLYHGAIHGVRLDPASTERSQAGSGELSARRRRHGHRGLARSSPRGRRATPESTERLQTAFGYGLVDASSTSTALPALEEELHRRAFGSRARRLPRRARAGGRRFAGLRGARAPPPRPAALAGLAPEAAGGQARGRVRMAGRGDRGDVTDVLDLQTRPERLVGPRPTRSDFETVQPGAPRFFLPAGPGRRLEGLKRSPAPRPRRHARAGRDARLPPVGRPVSALHGLLDGAELLAARPRARRDPRRGARTCSARRRRRPSATDDIAEVAAERSRPSGGGGARARRRRGTLLLRPGSRTPTPLACTRSRQRRRASIPGRRHPVRRPGCRSTSSGSSSSSGRVARPLATRRARLRAGPERRGSGDGYRGRSLAPHVLGRPSPSPIRSPRSWTRRTG